MPLHGSSPSLSLTGSSTAGRVGQFARQSRPEVTRDSRAARRSGPVRLPVVARFAGRSAQRACPFASRGEIRGPLGAAGRSVCQSWRDSRAAWRNPNQGVADRTGAVLPCPSWRPQTGVGDTGPRHGPPTQGKVQGHGGHGPRRPRATAATLLPWSRATAATRGSPPSPHASSSTQGSRRREARGRSALVNTGPP
jgi:hypothetical protein